MQFFAPNSGNPRPNPILIDQEFVARSELIHRRDLLTKCPSNSRSVCLKATRKRKTSVFAQMAYFPMFANTLAIVPKNGRFYHTTASLESSLTAATPALSSLMVVAQLAAELAIQSRQISHTLPPHQGEWVPKCAPQPTD